MPYRPRYGEHSPFDREERETINAIIAALQGSKHPHHDQVLATVAEHFERLEAFGDLLARFPSPLARHNLGDRVRSIDSLMQVLCQSSMENLEFRAPTRAIVGRALDMAESNFYRLLRHACREILPDGQAEVLRAQAADRLREVIYTKLVEEVLSDIVSDVSQLTDIRRRAGYAIAEIWDRRLTYRTREIFPLLDATWEARDRVQVVGGTLLGTQEMYALIREGCDPRFVDFFVRPNPSADEVSAFREFLFAASAEALDGMAQQLQHDELARLPLRHSVPPATDDPDTRVYEFFRQRFLTAMARRLMDLPGPKRTAEGYVMIEFLGKSAPRLSDPALAPDEVACPGVSEVAPK